MGGFSLRPVLVLRLDLLRRQFQDRFAHFFTRLELYNRSGRNRHIRRGSVGIASHAGFAHFNFEHAEIAQLDLLTAGDSFRNVIQCFLDDCQHILLHQPGLLTYPHYQVTLSHKVLAVNCSGAWLMAGMGFTPAREGWQAY